MFPGTLQHSLAGRALKSEKWSYEAINLRDYTVDRHKSVDDTPYGGGAGMVMRADVVGRAIDAQKKKYNRLIYFSPRGRPITQEYVAELSQEQHIGMICGRFEGLDERVIEEYGCEEVSLGDFVMSGGEIAALALMDACVRLLPGVLGNAETLSEESFAQNADYTGLLEYPLYTRPSEWKNRSVPDILLSGDHKAVEQWRQALSEEITRSRRPDLWRTYLRRGYK
jgi:tRNA (guanine37-N1)-methyltransferase